MTHRQCYNATDLWTLLRCKDLDVELYRVVFDEPRARPLLWPMKILSRFVATRLLGCDYADNLAVIARRSTATKQRDDAKAST
jgi:hypothetical protein